MAHENALTPASYSAWIERDGAAVPVIDTGSLEVTSYPFVNDAAAGTSSLPLLCAAPSS